MFDLPRPHVLRLSELIEHAKSALAQHGDMTVHVEMWNEDATKESEEDGWELIGAPVTRTPIVLQGRAAVARTRLFSDNPTKKLFLIGGE